MNMNLSPRSAEEKISEGEGGSYYSWSSSKFPLLSEAKVGGGRLLLHRRGFALPHYADSSKIAYVLQGSCTVGMVLPNAPEEKLLKIEKGDALPVPSGVVSWWFNGGDSDVEIVFIGETSKSHVPGEFTYFLLTGTMSVLRGFSTEFISRAYDMKEGEANKLITSQTGTLIIKLEEGIQIPQPHKNTGSKMTFPIDSITNGGFVSTLTAAEFPFLEQVGLSARLVKLDGKAASSSPMMYDSAVRVSCVIKGSGRVQLVGINGERVVDAEVKAGEVFVVPPFFVAMEVADDGEGLECFSVITSPRPVSGQLSGSSSIWKALSPVVLQASLGVTSEFVEIFTSKITEN